IDAQHHSFAVYTDTEALSPTWQNTVGGAGLVVIGDAALGATQATYVYAALWSGTSAEISAGQAKAMLMGLGWSVTGY
ncbi:MAG TPA: hypothetical protein VGC41_03315, partial [Kofleriaceae bacterium]